MRAGLTAEAGWARVRARESWLWINPGRRAGRGVLAGLSLTAADLADAVASWRAYAPLLAVLFPELQPAGGAIESPLIPAPRLATRVMPGGAGRLYVKADHALPVAGSIKARGGIFAVLREAERIARAAGLPADGPADLQALAGPAARRLFAEHELSVGSTGNLGLSIGIAGAALGFRVSVHMSVEAKEWKKARLRQRGVRVVEHATDYTEACVVARAEAAGNPRLHFIDDENSTDLFLGYAAAAAGLARQLAAAGERIGPDSPLFLYLPCGVGGAPGGITFGARHVFGDDAHAFFVEPLDAPCMMLGLLTGRHADVSVRDAGLALKTEADGLATARPSRFVGRLMEPLLSGCLTLPDAAMYRFLLDLYETEGLEVELSAAAGCGGPGLLYGTDAGRAYLDQTAPGGRAGGGVHVVWTTGGSFVPADRHAAYRERARAL